MLAMLAGESPGASFRDLVSQWLAVHMAAAVGLIWFYFGRVRPDRIPAEASHYGSHGTARFARREEIWRYLKADGHGLILGKEGGRYLILPRDPAVRYNRNVTVIGGSGVGKTRAFVQPNILQAAQYGGESLVVIDPKAENFARSAALLRSKGYGVHLFNLLQPDHSDRWNPLDAVSGITQATDLAANLVANTVNPNRPRGGDPFWDNAEQAFITALVLYVKLHRPPPEHHMASVLEMGTDLPPEALDDIFQELPVQDPARRFYRSFLRAEEKIRAGVVAGLGSRLQLWNSPDVAALTSASDFHIAGFAEKASALFLVIPDSKATYAPLLALFWQQVFEELYRVADEAGGRLPIPVRCVMDEIANCGYIPDYEKKKSTMRSRGISTEEVWQSLGQIKARYPATWAELLANADHMLFLGTNDLETAQYVSQKVGLTTIRLQSLSNSQSDRSATTGQSEAYGGRPLMTVDEVLRLPGDQALLIPRATYPIRITKADFEEHPLAVRIALCDHKQYQPPDRDPVVITDVAALRDSVRPEEPAPAHPAKAKRAPAPPAAQQAAPAQPGPPAGQPHDLTSFLDPASTDKKGGVSEGKDASLVATDRGDFVDGGAGI